MSKFWKEGRLLISDEEYNKLLYKFCSRRSKPNRRKVCNAIDKRRPESIREESWETFTYTTRVRLIEENERKLLLEAQQKLFDELVKNAQLQT
jgi:hypothetical protein